MRVSALDRPEITDLADQQRLLRDLLAGLSEADLDRPTPAAGWSVRDQLGHLADTDEVAVDTVLGGPRTFAAALRPYRTAEEFTAAGAARAAGRSLDDLATWLAGQQDAIVSALAGVPAQQRVAWGFGLPAATFAQARLMETWAHSWDVHQALGRPMPLLAAGRHVAELGLRTVPFALRRAGLTPPAGRRLRVDLDAGEFGRWSYGPADATDRVSGAAPDWLLVVTCRADEAGRGRLHAEGDLARLAIRHARAYL